MSVRLLIPLLGNTLSPAPLSEEKQQELLRTAIANLLTDTLREHGCGDCGALAVEDKLHIWNSQLSPRATASHLLQNRKAVRMLKKAGFNALVITQGSNMLSGPHFEYPIR